MKRRAEVAEKFWLWIAWAVPRTLAYWCFVRVATYNYGGGPDEQLVSEIMKRWTKEDSK